MWFAIGIPTLAFQCWVALVPLVHILFSVTVRQFEAAFDVLDASIAQLGIDNHLKSVTKAQRRRLRALDQDMEAAVASASHGRVPMVGHLRVTDEALERFHDRWVAACRNHEELMRQDAWRWHPAWVTVACNWLVPATQVYLARLSWPAFSTWQQTRLVFLATGPLIWFWFSLGVSVFWTTRLRRLVAQSQALVCADPSARVFLSAVCAVPAFRAGVVPATPAVFAAVVLLSAASYVPYAYADWTGSGATLANATGVQAA